MRRWKRKKPQFKEQALERMKDAANIVLLVQELGISRSTLYRWRDTQLGRVLPKQAPGKKSPKREIEELKQALVKRTLEVDFFKGALQRIEARRQQSTVTGREASTTKSTH